MERALWRHLAAVCRAPKRPAAAAGDEMHRRLTISGRQAPVSPCQRPQPAQPAPRAWPRRWGRVLHLQRRQRDVQRRAKARDGREEAQDAAVLRARRRKASTGKFPVSTAVRAQARAAVRRQRAGRAGARPRGRRRPTSRHSQASSAQRAGPPGAKITRSRFSGCWCSMASGMPGSRISAAALVDHHEVVPPSSPAPAWWGHWRRAAAPARRRTVPSRGVE